MPELDPVENQSALLHDYESRLPGRKRPIPSAPTSPRTRPKSIYSDRFIPSRRSSVLSATPQRPSLNTFSLLLQQELLPSSRIFRFQTPDASLHKSLPTASPQLLRRPPKPRKIAKTPFKVLDAPSLADDFYLHLVDWGPANVLAVGLGSCVYLWSACTSHVTKLCTLDTPITSVAFNPTGHHLAIGTHTGLVHYYDIKTQRPIQQWQGHEARVGTLAWHNNTLSSGSRDRKIVTRDVRATNLVGKWEGHRQEVCGLEWSPDGLHLASGGNDNKLMIWSRRARQPLWKFHQHGAAVKALAWSPHQQGLLASGGGTADRCIRFWAVGTGRPLNCVDTGSQVCNLMWAKNVNEIVSTHGYSLNQVIVWRYPNMAKLATLTGHSLRVLYLAMSPDGQTIVTGAGDETLRFWNAFPGPAHKQGPTSALHFPGGGVIR